MLADLVIVSGYSGAGKSSAMNVFEDAGYYCVDNLPPAMIRSLAAMFTDDGATVELNCADLVTSFTASDFNRTFPSNGKGSDHAWGSHHLVMGGAAEEEESSEADQDPAPPVAS